MLILVGASASGKTELARLLTKQANFQKNVTYTSRMPRINEKDGFDYFFISKEQFLQLKTNSFFVETAEYRGNWYGSAKNQILPYRVIILEPIGVTEYHKQYPDDCYIVNLVCSKTIREQRMRSRGDHDYEIKRRLEYDEQAFQNKFEKYNLVLDSTNQSLENLLQEIVPNYQNWLNKKI